MLNNKGTLWYKGMVNSPPVLETVPTDTWICDRQASLAIDGWIETSWDCGLKILATPRSKMI